MRTFQVALLIYLTVSEHFLSVVALRTALGAESKGVKAVTGMIYSPPTRQKYRYKEPKCHKPYNKGNRDGMCRFYKCDHMRNRDKMESHKMYVLSTAKGFREKDFLKDTAKYMHRAHKVVLRGASLQCDWAQTIGDEFATWAEKQMPGAYGCIRKAMEIQAGKTRTKCKEGFTREFEGRLRKECRDQLEPNLKAHKNKKRWARGLTVGAGAVVGVSTLPAPLAALGVVGLAAVAIALHVCKKYKVEKPKWTHQGMFENKKITTVITTDVPQSDLPNLGEEPLDLSLQEEKDPSLQEEKAKVGLDEVEKQIEEEEDEVDLLGLGDESATDGDGNDPKDVDLTDDSSTETPWWEGIQVGPAVLEEDFVDPAAPPTPQNYGDLLGDLLTPTPVASSVPVQTKPAHYVDPMTLYASPAPTNPFLPQFGSVPAHPTPMNMYGQSVWSHPSPSAPGGFTPAWDENSAPQQTPVSPPAPPPVKKSDELFADLKW